MAKSFDLLAKRVMSAKSRARADRRAKELLDKLAKKRSRRSASPGNQAIKLPKRRTP